MKKNLLMGLAVVLSTSLSAQFSDNFDSYIVGNNLVTQNPTDWDTWSGGAGTTEDVAISDVESSSGANSLYFASTGGGPTDIILRFAQVYNSGSFSLESNFFVESGKGAYFNLQETFVVGGVWAIDCFMLDNGTMKFSNSGTPYLTTTYPTGQWFNMRIDIDLTANVWEVFIDNVSQGTFSNTVGSIAILNLYPTNPTAEGGNNTAGFYVDDVSYTHTPANLPAVNGGVTFLNPITGIVGQNINVEATVRNLGTDPITSFDLEYTYNGAPAVVENVTGLSLASLATYDYTFTAPVTLVNGSMPLTVTVSNVNGAGADADASDDSKMVTVDPTVPAAGKMVLGEEATGTWCQWCPRGAVFMEFMETTYPDHWAGVAVHNGDPMTDTTYDNGIGPLIGGYPSSLVDRGNEGDPNTMEQSFLQRIVIPPTALITNGAAYDAATRVLEVSVTADFQMAASGDWRIGVILTEDGVTGTAGYDQSNAYAGGGNGEMGGYEILPNPVPAAQMVYDHVARTIVPGFDGLVNSFPATIPSGLVASNCFNFTLPADWDENNLHIISFLMNPVGEIDNAGKETITSAVANGYIDCGAVSVFEDLSKKESFNLFPNPTNGVSYINISNNNGEKVNVTITDLSGKVVAQRDYNVNGTVQLPIVTNEFSKGVYVVTLTQGETTQQQKLIVQ